MATPPRRSQILAGALWLIVIGIVATAIVIVLLPTSVEVPGRSGGLTTLLSIGVLVAYASVGALLVARQPNNLVGWLLLAVGLCVALGILASAYAGEALVVSGGRLPGGEFGAWAVAPLVILGLVLGGPVLILVFPDGHLPSRRWRPIAWLLAVGIVGGLLDLAITPGPLGDFPTPNPFGVEAIEPILGPMDDLFTALFLVGVIGAGLSIVARYRSADAVGRQQLKWFGYVAVIAAIALAVSVVSGSGFFGVPFALFLLALICLPIAVGIAVLRYRLYDIDVLIGRTLVYVPLTAILAGLYTASVALFQRAFVAVTGNTSDAAIVISALILASLFTPIRRWLEGIVERRFKPGPAAGPGIEAIAEGSPGQVAWDARMAAIASRVVRRELVRREAQAARRTDLRSYRVRTFHTPSKRGPGKGP